MNALEKMKLRMNGAYNEKTDRKNAAKETLELMFSGDPSFQENVQILNKHTINCRLTNYRKEEDAPPKMDIQATIDNEFELGDVFLIKDHHTGLESHWICVDKNNFFNIYFKGLVRECNQLFRFQNGTSSILEYWGFTENPYSTTLSKGNIVSYPTNKLNFTMPYNDDTKKIFIDKRFITEIGYDKNGKAVPIIYKITSRESKTTNFGGGRFLKLMAEFCAHCDADSVEFMVADYVATDPPLPPQTDALRCTISGTDIIKAGGSVRAYTAAFYSSDARMPDDAIAAEWTLDVPAAHAEFIHLTHDATHAYIGCDDNDALIGTTFKLILSDADGLYAVAEKVIKVVSIYG